MRLPLNIMYFYLFTRTKGWWYASNRRLCLYSQSIRTLNTSSFINVYFGANSFVFFLCSSVVRLLHLQCYYFFLLSSFPFAIQLWLWMSFALHTTIFFTIHTYFYWNTCVAVRFYFHSSITHFENAAAVKVCHIEEKENGATLWLIWWLRIAQQMYGN